MIKYSMREHCKVERVTDGIAYGSFQIPLRDLEEITSLVDHILYASRWLRTQSRVAQSLAQSRVMRGAING